MSQIRSMQRAGEEELVLFDGSDETWNHWSSFGPKGGSFFTRTGDAIVTCPGPDQALLYYADAQFGNFVLNVGFRLGSPDNNAGVLVRFRDPRQLRTDLIDRPHIKDNPAWVATYTGYEVQIDDQARPDGQDRRRTGAIYDIPTVPYGSMPMQAYNRPAPLSVGQWHTFEIVVRDDEYEVRLKAAGTSNYQLISLFINRDLHRGLPPWQDAHSGFIGIQAHSGHVAFRNITIQPVL